MANKEQTIKYLQAIVTGLSQQALGHDIQSKIFDSKGFKKLAEKYAEHAVEERGYVDKCIDRILDLGGEVKNEAKPEAKVCTNPIDWIKYDLQVSIDGLKFLEEVLEATKGDYTTYDILKDYYKDEEEDMYWAEQQLELIECIGTQNWIINQI